MSRMGKRIVFGAIMIAVLAVILWGDWRLEYFVRHEMALSPSSQDMPIRQLLGLPTVTIMGVTLILAFFELSRMTRAAGLNPLPVSGIIGIVAAATGAWWFFEVPGVSLLFPVSDMVALALVLGLVFGEQMIRYRKEQALTHISATVLAIAYLGACGGVVVHIRLAFGVPALVLFLAAAKFTDIGAYFTGSAIGRHKLIPWLSPGKTWEGLIGGLAAGAGICMLIVVASQASESMAWRGLNMGVWTSGLFGAVVGLAGQFADLCESLLKRSANLKDSGAVLPEFGGVLDIIDSVLLSAPVAAIMLAVLAR